MQLPDYITSASSFQEILDDSTLAYVIISKNLKIKFYSAEFQLQLGYSNEELVDKYLFDLLSCPQADLPKVSSVIDRLKILEQVSEQLIISRKEGVELHAQLDLFMLTKVSKADKGYLVIFSFVSSMKDFPETPLSNNDRILENINYAQKLQDALFRKTISPSLFEDIFIIDQPKDQVGGDFYIIDTIQNRKVIFLGDCTGHGVSGAMLTALCGSILTELFRIYKTLSPSLIINKTQKRLEEMLSTGKERGVSDSLEATLLFIDERTKEISYASTVQEIYYVGDDVQKLLKFRKKKGEELVDERFAFEFGKMIYLSSDGLKDQFGGDRYKKIGSKRIFEWFQESHQLTCSNQKKLIARNLREWTGEGGEQTDDILMIGIRL